MPSVASHRRPDADEGTVLILTLILSVVIAMTIASAIISTSAMERQSRFEMEQAKALALAEGVTEVVQKSLLTQVANFIPISPSGVVTLDGEQYPYTIESVGSPIERIDLDGTNMVIQPYRISSTVDAEIGSATVTRIVDLTMSPLFQFMIFAAGDLEILPGPDMTIDGRVHSNQSIYIGTGASSTLTLDTDYVKGVRGILRKKKSDNTPTDGAVNIKVHQTDVFQALDRGRDSVHSGWRHQAKDTWGSSVQTADHGLKAIAAPGLDNIKAFDPLTGAKGHYHANADLVVMDQGAFGRDGAPVNLPLNTIREETLHDGREGKTVKVTEIDMALLGSSDAFPANGLLYAFRRDSSPTQPNGVSLTNGSTLKGPLTVVTEGPIYVRGDYNSNNSQGAAVMADAVNLLSNAWDGSKTPGSLPVATETTYILAIVTGNVATPDGGGHYSGGFENLPRFHENWNGVTARIRGAFINTFESKVATSQWRYGDDAYMAPIRDWRFDKSFMKLSKLPPFTPNAVYCRRVLWDDDTPLALMAR
ncbi:MAG TPA: hypothetical protein VMT52_18970 [Planctomycetota bacterium]|nr:hypothetical protein [Planctomycetota bacterium]